MPLASIIHHWLADWDDVAVIPGIDDAPYQYFIFRRNGASFLTMHPAEKPVRQRGFANTGWTVVSERFRFSILIDRDLVDATVNAAWAAHAGSADAVLQAAIHDALTDAGVKRYDGATLS